MKKIILLLLIGLITSMLYGQNVKWIRYIMSNSNIPGNCIRDLKIDNNNNKWIIFCDNNTKIAKFDGVNWEIFDLDSIGFKDVNPQNIVIDKFNNIWFGTNHGLLEFDGKNWKEYKYKSVNWNITSMAIDKNNIIWIGTYHDGLIKFDGLNWTEYNLINLGMPYNCISTIAIDKDGNIWFADGENLIRFKNNKFTLYDTTNSGLSGDYIFTLAIDIDGDLWIGALNELIKFDGYNWVQDNGYYFGVIKIDNNGNKWIGREFGLEKFDGVKSTFFSLIDIPGFPFGYATHLEIDKEGFEWVGTDTFGDGLFKLEEGGPGPYNINSYIISGRVFDDKNKNKEKDNDENYIGGQKVMLLPDSIINISDANGRYSFAVNSGDYKIQYIKNTDWNLSTNSEVYKISVYNDSIIPDFGVYSSTTNVQTKIKILVNSDIARCGREGVYNIDYINTGNDNGDGIVKFKPDSKLTRISSFPVWDSIVNGIYYWNFKGLYPTEKRQIRFKVINPGFGSMGDTLISDGCANIKSSYTNQSHDDFYIYKSIVNCSCDPNDKSVETIGTGVENKTYFNNLLRYTIRFQNTGNDTAFDVRVLDTLSRKLDWSTFKVAASSNNVNTSINKNGIVTFMFNNILLPDSGKNYPGSCGFVTYEILPTNDSLPFEVENTAYIYFDYNQSVKTNTVITKINKVSVDLGNDLEICNGESIELKIKNSDTKLKYKWSTGDTTLSIKISPNLTTTYTVTATLGNFSDTDDIIVRVKNVVVGAGADVTICRLDTTRLTAIGGRFYRWSTGSRLQSIVVNPTSTAIYKVTITKSAGSSSTASVKVTVNYVTVDAGPDKTVCKGKNVQLQIADYSPGVKYKWNTGDSTGAVSVNPVVLKLYTVTAKQNNCSAKDYVIVRPYSIIANAGYDKTICLDKITTLTALGGASYQWTMDNGQLKMGQVISVSPAVRTTYVVTVTNNRGCTASDDVVVSVTNCKDKDIKPSSPTPLPKEREVGLRVYPNPFSDMTTIEYTMQESGHAEIGIYDMMGRKIEETVIYYKDRGVYNFELNRKNLNSGVYFVRLEIGTGIYIRKLIVE
ncbi:MAG: two-component regulator propeller domain-containing protein [Bacteroidota bacterium]|nr:two-component regulator propeller domain-containing protein [Bacteroidota bacterium]